MLPPFLKLRPTCVSSFLPRRVFLIPNRSNEKEEKEGEKEGSLSKKLRERHAKRSFFGRKRKDVFCCGRRITQFRGATGSCASLCDIFVFGTARLILKKRKKRKKNRSISVFDLYVYVSLYPATLYCIFRVRG